MSHFSLLKEKAKTYQIHLNSITSLCLLFSYEHLIDWHLFRTNQFWPQSHYWWRAWILCLISWTVGTSLFLPWWRKRMENVDKSSARWECQRASLSHLKNSLCQNSNRKKAKNTESNKLFCLLVLKKINRSWYKTKCNLIRPVKLKVIKIL